MIQGRIVPFITVILVGALLTYYGRKMKSGCSYKLRKIPALEAIEEAIGRATELGRPVFFSGGFGDVVGSEGMQVLAGLDILSFAARKCAEYNLKIVSAVCNQNVQAVTEEVVRQAYSAAGRPEAYQPEMVQFLSPTQMAYTAASIAIIRREQVAASILVGPFFGEALIIADAAAEIGAIGIAGTARMSQLPLFVAACDYVLIGEEMFAGSAYLSGSPAAVGSIAAQDIMKLIAAVLVLVGSLLKTASIDWVATLLRR
ncbi:MAG TPA: hypothetical protein GXX30_01035 [Firmicutes bacterium]|nr:hypothetical protein [Candidatus Fermentithermobacillaceae bacterium]